MPQINTKTLKEKNLQFVTLKKNNITNTVRKKVLVALISTKYHKKHKGRKEYNIYNNKILIN